MASLHSNANNASQLWLSMPLCLCLQELIQRHIVSGRFELASVAFPLELPAAYKLGPQAHKSKINHNMGALLTHIC